MKTVVIPVDVWDKLSKRAQDELEKAVAATRVKKYCSWQTAAYSTTMYNNYPTLNPDATAKQIGNSKSVILTEQSRYLDRTSKHDFEEEQKNLKALYDAEKASEELEKVKASIENIKQFVK